MRNSRKCGNAHLISASRRAGKWSSPIPDPQAAIRQLLALRGPGRTICPSEAARLVAGTDGDWRAQMSRIHDAVDALLAAQSIQLSWKGERLAQRSGPYRIEGTEQ
ncbi:MAG: DUF3253 domain-containing protein [Alteripontixanthobacter sp.]